MSLVEAAPVARDWRAYALCRGKTELFFPEPDKEIEVAAAISTCMSCPVRVQCSLEARLWHEHHGIWGGELLDAKVTHRKRRECPRCWSSELMRWDGNIECIGCGMRWVG